MELSTLAHVEVLRQRGQSQHQIARALNIPRGQVCIALRRIRELPEHLRNALEVLADVSTL
jgi:transcriptional regulator